VFVKYRPQANLTALTPAIKNMVARSVEGLAYDNVSITLVPGAMIAPPPPPSSAGRVIGGLIAIGIVLLLAGLGWVVLRRPAWLPAAVAQRLPKIGGAAAGAA
jgi:type III secretion protein J